jgi:hypothetical protein
VLFHNWRRPRIMHVPLAHAASVPAARRSFPRTGARHGHYPTVASGTVAQIVVSLLDLFATGRLGGVAHGSSECDRSDVPHDR